MSGPTDASAIGAGRLHIVHVVAPAEYGGLERVVHALVAGHTGRGHRVAVAAIVDARTREAHPFLAPVVKSGAELEIIRVAGRGYLRERSALRALLARFAPDIVHTHGYRPDVLDAGVARSLGLPIVTTVHGFTGGDWKNRAYEWLQRRASRRFDAVVAVSRLMFEELRAGGLTGERLHLVPNAWTPAGPLLGRVAARRELGLDADGWHIGFVGRLRHEKGADVLLDALAYLRDLPISLSIVGEGVERARLQQRARRIGVTNRVRWHGAVGSAGRLLRAFDVFALSSRTEGTPIALFEAMTAGLPVVATRVGGVPDVINESEGLLVPPGDPASLASALRACFEDYAAARGRALAAAERLARDFSPLPWLERYEQVYFAAIAASRRSARD